MFRMWYYLSPGIYPLTRISAQYLNIYYLNPFATFFGGYHWAIMEGQPLVATWAIVYSSLLSLFALVGGWALFVRASPRFVKLSS